MVGGRGHANPGCLCILYSKRSLRQLTKIHILLYRIKKSSWIDGKIRPNTNSIFLGDKQWLEVQILNLKESQFHLSLPSSKTAPPCLPTYHSFFLSTALKIYPFFQEELLYWLREAIFTQPHSWDKIPLAFHTVNVLCLGYKYWLLSVFISHLFLLLYALFTAVYC